MTADIGRAIVLICTWAAFALGCYVTRKATEQELLTMRRELAELRDEREWWERD